MNDPQAGTPPGRTRKRGRRRLYTIAAATAALLAGAGTALAAVSLTPQTNTVGAGGYTATTTASSGFSSVQAVINGGQYGLTVAGGRHGVKMCNSTSGEAAAVGLFSNNLNTDYAVQYGVGVSSPGCPAGETPALVTFPGLAAVPFGHHVWVNERLVTRTRTVRILVCVLVDRHDGRPVPTPSPSNPTASPSITASVSQPTASPTDITGSGGTESPTESPSVTQPTASPSITPSVSQPTAEPTPTPSGTPTINPNGSIGGLSLPGFTLRCRIITRTITRNVVLFEAQDLDAPVATPLSGDLAGVQTATLHVPAGTVFDTAAAGVSENVTALTHCLGGGFPITLNGTPLGQVADYASAACQEVSVFEYSGATIGTGPFTDWLSLNTQELISPSAGGALVAPNGSITTANLGPHGTSPDASTTGDHWVNFTGNAPVS